MIGIVWKDSYATQVACFDAEHKRLVYLVDRYFKAVQEKRGLLEVGEVLAQLLDYTQYHFANEEKLMKDYAYPRYQGHCLEHRKMIATVKGFQLMLTEPGQDRTVLLLAVRNFLRDWLLDHIVEEDKQYGPFFNEKGIC